MADSILIPGKKLFIPESGLTQYERNKIYQVQQKGPVKSKQKSTGNFIWPISGKISSYYGFRLDPFNKLNLFHRGIDIKADYGTSVKAPKGGKVIYIGKDKIYGNILMIRHDAQYVTVYAHLKAVNVKLNQQIRQGDVIAFVGTSGRSTGPHLHFEIRKNGRTLNPLKLLK